MLSRTSVVRCTFRWIFHDDLRWRLTLRYAISDPFSSTKQADPGILRMDGQDIETTDVVICGCGPTGALLGAYLGQMSVPNIILEKEADITTDPRGIALDEDGIRLLQGAGLYDSIYTEIGTCKSSTPSS